MSDDEEPDLELLALLRQSLGLGQKDNTAPADTKVLKNAEYVYDNAIDVAIDYWNTKAAASTIWDLMQQSNYSSKTWSAHELHPKTKDEAAVDFIFTMDLLNFSFWSDDESSESFTVEYLGKKWTGYWSLVAALQRALEEGISITSSDFWQDGNECTDDLLKHVFRSTTATPIPLLDERIGCLREAGQILYKRFNCSFLNCINETNGSAAALVNLLVESFPCFRDESRFEGKTIRFYKRAQILVADLWACFDGQSYGKFADIETITMFADYRIPQMLHTLGCISYSPTLTHQIQSRLPISPGHKWEIQLRGCSIWCVELIRREILRQHPKAEINAILLDFFLYDTIKAREEAGGGGGGLGLESGLEMIPHHRTRSIWY